MYLHLGQDTVIKENDIIGIFDLDNTSVSKHTRKYLNDKEKSGKVINVSTELPKSFIVVTKNKETRVYISQISPSTLIKRTDCLDKIKE